MSVSVANIFELMTYESINITRNAQLIWEGAPCDMDRARLLASDFTQQRLALCASNHRMRSIRLPDEIIRLAVGLRLRLGLCEEHPCPHGTTIASRGALKRANVPATKEPTGLPKGD